MARLRQSHVGRQGEVSATDIVIPDKLYFRIGEVSELTQTRPYVLRFWETEFPTLRPMKSPSGHRLYRRQDIEMVLRIKQLLYEKGFTIQGARKQLQGDANESEKGKTASPSPLDGTRLKAIKRELQSVLTILSRR